MSAWRRRLKDLCSLSENVAHTFRIPRAPFEAARAARDSALDALVAEIEAMERNVMSDKPWIGEMTAEERARRLCESDSSLDPDETLTKAIEDGEQRAAAKAREKAAEVVLKARSDLLSLRHTTATQIVADALETIAASIREDLP